MVPEDARSHLSHLSSKSRAPSIADLTGKPAYPGLGLGFSRPGTFCKKSDILLFSFLSQNSRFSDFDSMKNLNSLQI